MQNNFVGDVGDLAKYALLRAVRGLVPDAKPLLSLGVVWYLPDDATVERTPWRHGRDVGYLFNDRSYREHRDLDPVLYRELKRIVCEDRTVDAVATSDLLGSDTAFWPEPIPMPKDKNARPAGRREWLTGAHQAMKGRDVVFLDPDTGMAHEDGRAPKQLSRTDRNAPKYAFVDEIEPFVDGGQSVVIYQSFHRNASRCDQKVAWRRLFPDHDLRIREFGSRAFILLPIEAHMNLINDRLRSWSEHLAI